MTHEKYLQKLDVEFPGMYKLSQEIYHRHGDLLNDYISEVAQQLGRHKASVYWLIYTGHLRPLPGTGDRLISEHELDRFLRSPQGESTKRRKKYTKREVAK